MKKPIAVICSDIHLNLWTKFNDNNKRTLDSFKVLFNLKKLCITYKVPLICCGDLFHKQESMDNELMDLVFHKFNELLKEDSFVMVCISGNHDMKYTNTYEKNSPSFVKTLSLIYERFICLDFKQLVLRDNNKPFIHITGVPYLDHNIGLNEYLNKVNKKPIKEKVPKLLLLHTDYEGARDTDGRVIGSVENLNVNLFKPFDLVLCGHIHKPQKLSKKAYMIGAPIQQRRTDRNCEMGYWVLYSDLSMKFISLSKNFPKFIDVENEDDIKDDGNYYTILPKKLEKDIVKTNKITRNLSKKKLAKRYCKQKGVNKERTNLLVNILNKVE